MSALAIEPSPDVVALLGHTSMSQADIYRWAMVDAVLLRIERRRAAQAKASTAVGNTQAS